MSAPIVAPIALAHAEILAQLHARCFDEAWDVQAMTGLLETPGTFGLIGSRDAAGPPSAFALARRALDEAEILSIGVVPEVRGAGLGGAVLLTLLDAARAKGVRQMFLEVAADNAAAIQLYVRAGFTDAGHRKAYYARAGRAAVDARVMKLAL